MRISKYIDYIDDPEDTFLQYINKGNFMISVVFLQIWKHMQSLLNI